MAEYLCKEDMNTDEYISRDLALRQLNATCLVTDCDNYNGVRCRACAYADAMDLIDAIPVADVHPVKRGKWMPHKITASSKCSECRRVFADETPYCPNCGARMDGDAENE